MASPTVEAPTTTDSPTPPSARSSLSKRVSVSSPPASSPQQRQSTAGAIAETGPSPPSEPRQSVGDGAPGSPPAAAAVVPGAPGEPSPPRKSVSAGAPGESSPSPQPRKSITAGAPGAPGAPGESSPSSQHRKSVTAGGTPAGSPTTPASPSSQSPAPSTPGSTKEVSGEPVKKTPPTGWDYSQPLPNRFFRPSLTDLCFPVLAKNFAKFPGFGNLPPDERLRVVDEIALDLPLNLAADLIPEEPYWKRRVQAKWRNCDINAHGRSWKQLFFERNLAEALERFDRTVDKESSLEELIKTSAPYVHNLDIVELPSHISFLLLFNALKRDLTGLRVNFGNPNCGWDYNRKQWGIKRSDCLSLSAALSVTTTLTSLHLSSNRIDPKKMGILAKGLMANPTVVDLDLSSNFLSDEGVREVAKVVTANNSVLGMLNLARNRITSQGCIYLAECEDANKSLLSLNLASNQFGDLGGKRIIDWANNNTSIQRLSLESCDIGEDSAQSFVRLMHNTHSALTSINMSGNHAIGVKNGDLLLAGLEVGKQMKELWINNSQCGEELEKKILTFLVERLFGRTCFHHPGVREAQVEEPASQGVLAKEAELQKTEEQGEEGEEEAKKKEEEDAKKENEEEDDDESEEEKKEREKKEAEKKAQEDAAAAAAAEEKARQEAIAHEEEENIIHVGHGHDEACTLECSHMVGLPSTSPPPEPVVYPETAYASRDAQAAIKQIEDAKPYWGLEAIKDLKEKGT